MADLAAVFHWPPSELWNMEVDELHIWYSEAKRIREQVTQRPGAGQWE